MFTVCGIYSHDIHDWGTKSCIEVNHTAFDKTRIVSANCWHDQPEWADRACYVRDSVPRLKRLFYSSLFVLIG
jgi:hypothetical protein